jgi:hypothetical protein
MGIAASAMSNSSSPFLFIVFIVNGNLVYLYLVAKVCFSIEISKDFVILHP